MSASTLRRRAFPPNWGARTTAFWLILYAIYAFGQLDITWERLSVGFGESGRFLARMWPPNFSRAELLLADEPTSSLDPRTAVEIMELMTGLSASANVPLVVNIHNVDLARRFAQRIIGMAGGEIVFDGPPEDLQPEHLRQIYGGEDWL